MKSGRILPHCSTLLLALIFSLPVLGQKPPLISDLTMVDIQYMNNQRALIEDLTRNNFGSAFNRNRDHDLDLLQRLLDRDLVNPKQTAELQAMGIIMGDLLAADLDLHWVIYEDSVGRSRALRYRQSEEYLFPVTMISRRREADNRTGVNDVYQKAYDIMKASKPPLPFQ
ncbi:MAG: DUF3806 domain-containing protein [Halioglobus sp.]